MRCLSAILISVLSLWLAESAVAQTYNRPIYRGDRLDWCLTWGTNCGKPAADAFCNRHRYTNALVFRAQVPGQLQTTRLIGTNQVCRGTFCTAFAYITCESPIPSSRVFANPVWKGFRLDVCAQWGANCGKPAADAFCRSKGYSESLHAEADAQPGNASTRVIGTDQICNGSFCTGFQQIICK